MFTLQILDQLKTWNRPIQELQRITQPSSKKSKAIMPTAASNRDNEIVLPAHASPGAIAANNDIQTMWRAFKYTTGTKLLNILTHAELLGLAVSWFAKVCVLPFLRYIPGDIYASGM
jgi:hypothetical protein